MTEKKTMKLLTRNRFRFFSLLRLAEKMDGGSFALYQCCTDNFFPHLRAMMHMQQHTANRESTPRRDKPSPQVTIPAKMSARLDAPNFGLSNQKERKP